MGRYFLKLRMFRFGKSPTTRLGSLANPPIWMLGRYYAHIAPENRDGGGSVFLFSFVQNLAYSVFALAGDSFLGDSRVAVCRPHRRALLYPRVNSARR
jgi:hypothetical protein